jgi:hypothetical protein
MPPTAGDERDWERDFGALLAGLNADTAICRHGDHEIHKTPHGTWEDEHSRAVCVKAPPDQIGHGKVPDFIFHEPRPVLP